MSDDKSGEVLDFLRAWRETADRRLDRLEARLEEDRKQVEAELAALRARQDQAEVFHKGIAVFMTELQATLGRIERKLNDQ
jgi:hypothetical protein